MGLEPMTYGLKVVRSSLEEVNVTLQSERGYGNQPVGGEACAQRNAQRFDGNMAISDACGADARLRLIVGRWADLPDQIRAKIFALVQAAQRTDRQHLHARD